ncbi:TetR/AcrR family transcriptional regulator [Mesorhizobium sp. M1C.F.Ca.ET.193.01.1.1]|uniref:TetR/AcrR family transcriptional regulator n=1 Tax=unclassified Mesorhizobium TaxID=325217 RepID=UPI000FD26B7B|nr:MULTISPECIES: TetR/AcrR family transcriptional regulator [unclassified Mesorhizobium]TGS95634.1 TetR/AcrR family transcriptional regulator [bacterium M00.F.Ca.ET.177.01.1.1]TGQ51706.1 TetR/AcrR family transcriptional regulator [Mesorhizobium sp. M1C.F.Ca.ET.210.01.1.1]TGQ67941.1 TetR/AcrR family transcriptional regulator [Mesorhizobium sp. M1C.F.Ca.ET.212.01.1.1]TGR03025.1 TetR/AcrR family transcriptional regulator [Mesorhizobium sp. M1C.F.Ca.ET.204.01.1.1]TGR23564.1 TetR/AcrR family transc
MDSSIKKKRTRGRLSREMIEDAAFEVIEREGLSGFSMRKLAAALGCEAMSIYHHFPSQAHLYEALVDRQMSGLVVPDDDSLPWRERVRIGMQEFRRVATEHPAFAPFIVVYRMNSPPCLAKLNAIIGLFEDGGFGPELSARLFRAAGYYLMGAILDETAGYAKGPSAVTTVSDEDLARDYSSVVTAGAFFGAAGFDKTFELGLEMFLDEMERLREAARSEAAQGGDRGRKRK